MITFRRHMERQSDRAERVEKLFCKNERALVRTRLSGPGAHGDAGARCRHPGGRHPLLNFSTWWGTAPGRAAKSCPAMDRSRRATRWAGSSMARTIIVFAPDGFELCSGVTEGHRDPHGKRPHARAVIVRLVKDEWQTRVRAVVKKPSHRMTALRKWSVVSQAKLKVESCVRKKRETI